MLLAVDCFAISNGSVLLSSGKYIVEDNTNFYWNLTSKVLHLGSQLVMGNKSATEPNVSIAIDVQGIRGVRLPRITNAQVSSISLLEGTIFYNTDAKVIQFYDGSNWLNATPGSSDYRSSLSASAPLSYNSTTGVFSVPVSNSSQAGYLSAADWISFNAKISTSRAISTTAPITGGGDLSANRTIAIAAGTNSIDGYLTATDHTTFAAKFGSVSYALLATSRSLNTVFTPSATLLTDVCYSVKLGCAISFGGTCDGSFDVRSDVNATPVTSLGLNGASIGGTLIIGLTLSNGQTGQICGKVLPGHNVKIVTVSTSGSPSFTLVGQREVTTAFNP